MIISHKYKLIFIHIPKNAGSYITQLLYNLDKNLDTKYLGHIKAKDAQKILEESVWVEYTKICVIRNSWDYSVSLYSYIKGCSIHDFHNDIKNISYNEYLCFIENNNKLNINQFEFITNNDKEFIVDYLIDFNDLENNLTKFFVDILKLEVKTIKDFLPKNKINTSIRENNYMLYYDTTNSFDLTYNIYKQDIEIFNFEFDNTKKNKLLWPNCIENNV